MARPYSFVKIPVYLAVCHPFIIFPAATAITIVTAISGNVFPTDISTVIR